MKTIRLLLILVGAPDDDELADDDDGEKTGDDAGERRIWQVRPDLLRDCCSRRNEPGEQEPPVA